MSKEAPDDFLKNMEKAVEADLASMSPEARLREIEKMRADVEQRLAEIDRSEGDEMEKPALEATLDALDEYEAGARVELRQLN